MPATQLISITCQNDLAKLFAGVAVFAVTVLKSDVLAFQGRVALEISYFRVFTLVQHAAADGGGDFAQGVHQAVDVAAVEIHHYIADIASGL